MSPPDLSRSADPDIGALDAGLLDSIEIPIIVLSAESTIARFNRAAADAFGVTFADLGQRPCNTQALAPIPQIEEWCGQVLTESLAARHDVRAGDRMFMVRISPYADQNSRGTVLTFTNVTALRASLDRAIYEREYTKIILNTVADPLVVLDQDLQIQTGNRAFYEWFGVSRAHAQGRSLSDLGDETWKASSLWASLKDFGINERDFETLELKGSFGELGQRSIVLDARRMNRDGTALVLLAIRDVSAVRLAEEARRESEVRFRTLFESMDEGYCVVEVIFDDQQRAIDYRFLEVNPAFEKQTGIRNAQGRLMREIAPDHEQHWFELFGRIAATGETLRFENPAAALQRYYDVCAFRVGPPQRRQVGIVFNDITQRKNLELQRELHLAEEEKLRRQAELAAVALGEAQEALNRRVADLAAADRHRNEFLAILAHELRNPLAPVANAVQILRRSAGDVAMTNKARDMIERQVLHMSRLVTDLLEAARAHNGQIKLQTAIVDLRLCIEHVIELQRPLFESAQQTLHRMLPATPIWVNGDATRLEQVLTNLLSNAHKFTPAQGTIQVLAGTRTIAGVARAVVEISDTGEGIELELQPRIFDLFTQADRSLSHSKGGLGIGLSLVRTLVELHGGTVGVRSAGHGRGSTFEVSLALADAPLQGESLNAAPPDKRRVAERCILIVEDNEDIRESSRDLLALAGFAAVGVATGAQALQHAPDLKPSAILLDVGLPDMDGYDVARRLRAMPQFSRTMMIAITGYDTPQARALSAAAGFDHHICKPVDFETLLTLLEAVE